MHLLLVEDDPILAHALQAGLSHDGVAVDWERRGTTALASCDSKVHEALVLDLGLPDRDGFEILHRFRQMHPDLPIVIVTARPSVEDRIRGLEIGADDYIVKPFELVELLARLRAVRRRLHRGTTSPVQRGASAVARDGGCIVTFGNRDVELDASEFQLLQLLKESPAGLGDGRIRQHFHDKGLNVEHGVIEALMGALRAKLGVTITRLDDRWHCSEARALH